MGTRSLLNNTISEEVTVVKMVVGIVPMISTKGKSKGMVFEVNYNKKSFL
tara:strand:+ start:527 stop:676 length:150 start_codon:yes stop_codon:yes gene_type:complete